MARIDGIPPRRPPAGDERAREPRLASAGPLFWGPTTRVQCAAAGAIFLFADFSGNNGMCLLMCPSAGNAADGPGLDFQRVSGHDKAILRLFSQ
jgi:hypothetical protein